MGMNNNQRGIKLNRLLVSAFLCLMLMSFAGCFEKKPEQTDFDVQLKYGYNNNYESGYYIPFNITITSNRDDFEGYVQLFVRNDSGNYLYEKEVSLPAYTVNETTIIADVEDVIPSVDIRIANKKGKVIWENSFAVKRRNNIVRMGILSDDYQAFSYMSNVTAREDEIEICELNEENIYENANALELLDIIVVSDYSTDVLNDKQIEALHEWVRRGGNLIVGTGSTYRKTLAKLNGSLFDVETVGLSQKKILLGFSNNIYSEVDWETAYVPIDTLELKLNIKSSDTFLWDTDSAYGIEKYGYFLEEDRGIILLMTIDLSKNPVANNPLSEAMMEGIMERLYNYNNGGFSRYSGTDAQFFSLRSMVKMPPMFLYVAVFLVYAVLIPVFYVVMRKKGKTARLWLYYPLLALSCAFFVFCIGFTTRIIHPILNTSSIMRLDGTKVDELTQLSITVPDTREHEISLKKEFMIESKINDYYYGSMNELNKKHTIAFGENMDDNTVGIANTGSLNSRDFVLHRTYEQDGQIQIAWVDSAFEVTNHLGCNLEGAYFYFGDKYLYIGDMKDGETRRIEDLKEPSRAGLLSDIQDAYSDEEVLAVISGVLFGNLSPSYERYLMNMRGLTSAHDEAGYNENEVTFIACPRRNQKDFIQENTNYKERRAEVILISESSAAIVSASWED